MNQLGFWNCRSSTILSNDFWIIGNTLDLFVDSSLDLRCLGDRGSFTLWSLYNKFYLGNLRMVLNFPTILHRLENNFHSHLAGFCDKLRTPTIRLDGEAIVVNHVPQDLDCLAAKSIDISYAQHHNAQAYFTKLQITSPRE